jgi:serine/threonine protein phosphatase PrpC
MTLLAAIRYFAVSHIGLRRSRNEDSYAIYDSGESGPCADRRGVLFALADGIGGHACGDLASKMACQGLTTIFDNCTAGFEPKMYAQRLEDLIFSVDSRLRQHAVTHSDCTDMGTTLSALLINGNFSVTAHVGDSRIYRLRGNRLTQLTTDHSFVQEMIDEGELAPEAAIKHPLRSVLTRAVGTQESLEEVEIRTEDAALGDRFLLCSDGLHDMVSFEEIAATLKDGIDPRQSAEQLLNAALRNGGRDNVTIISIHLSAPEPNEE